MTQSWMRHLALCALCMLNADGCADDATEGSAYAASGAGRGGKSGSGSAAVSGSSAGNAAAAVERGRYLVENMGACGDCHTPRKPDGSFDMAQWLAGVDCFADADPQNPDFGCISSRNLTNDETGLKNRSDQQIKDMLVKGERPSDSGGKPDALHPIMPYWVLGNMSAADVNAMVAYLRTVPGVNHRVQARQDPFNVSAPAPLFPEAKIPMPRADYPQRSAAVRGRYLAGNLGICLECHTPRDAMGGPLVDRAFQGGRAFAREELGLPPVFPAMIYTSNITPDDTGIGGWSVQDVVNAIKQGMDKEQKPLCPPMPSGPMAPFGGITDTDAEDIAHYVLSIPAAANMIPAECTPPQPPGSGQPDGGGDAG